MIIIILNVKKCIRHTRLKVCVVGIFEKKISACQWKKTKHFNHRAVHGCRLQQFLSMLISKMVHISQLNTKRWENTGQIEKYNSNPLKIKNTFLLTHSPTEPGENVYAAFIF